MVISNSSSSSMTSSTTSSESAPTSSMNEVCRVICALFTPRFLQTTSMRRSSTDVWLDAFADGTVAPTIPGCENHRRQPHDAQGASPGGREGSSRRTMLQIGQRFGSPPGVRDATLMLSIRPFYLRQLNRPAASPPSVQQQLLPP